MSDRQQARLSLVRSDAAVVADPLPTTFDDLFRRFGPYVAAIGIRLLGRPHEVDDLVQDVFLAAHRGLRKLERPEAVKAWLASITVRTARRRLRSRRLWCALGMESAASYIDVADEAASPADRTLLAQVYRVLDRLPTNQRIAWTLRNLEGRELADVAAACGCSLATVKRWVTAAQDSLSRSLGT